jgi:hypothetical protein
LAGGASTVPSGRIRIPCASDPALKRWAILVKSLRDKGVAEFPKGIEVNPNFSHWRGRTAGFQPALALRMRKAGKLPAFRPVGLICEV